jgi:hypothetical protein
LVEDLFQKSFKLLRKGKLIELELESHFKLLDYLSEFYHAAGPKLRTAHCLKIVEQMRYVHDSVLTLITDDLMAGIILIQLSVVAKRATLYRKEGLYKHLAMLKLQAKGTDMAA